MKHTKELFSLDGKIAIVTGGRGLYGGSISTGLCEMGATVVIASRNGEACEEYAKGLRDEGYDAIGLSLDLSSDESINALVEEVIERYGKIDILVNNAVLRCTNGYTDTAENFTRSMIANATGLFIISQLYFLAWSSPPWAPGVSQPLQPTLHMVAR